ncbi:MAG TPA: flagellar brake protein [Methylophilaceae bacterium]|jgi:c-di-GMP-binding flagellar brake protein YcgR|nr:flagellar brake protein [Methylophilaceae bacterium]
MAETIESTLSVELTASTDDTRFLVTNRLEITRTLRGLAQRNEMVSAFFDNGKGLLLTSVLHVDPESDTVMLDYGSNTEINERILRADKIIFVTSLDRVKVQFTSQGVEKGSFESRPAFVIPFPGQVLQLQRREYYRLTTPIINPLICTVPLGQGRTEEFPIMDISAGGIGMIIGNSPDMLLKVGAAYPGCRIELPGVGVLELTLSIQSLFEVTLKNGSKSFRSGCQFVNLHPSMESLLQRYILKLERDRINSMPR